MKINEDLKIGASEKSLNELITNLSFLDFFNFEIKEKDNAKWLKVYYSNSKNGSILWSNIGELGWTFQTNKWSILGIIDKFYNESYGGYEFLLEYPSLNKSNRWRQTSNPLITSQSVTGYSAVNVTMTSNGWGGLSLSSRDESFIDGSPSATTWYYSIGQKKNESGGIPADQGVVQEVYLWIRIG